MAKKKTNDPETVDKVDTQTTETVTKTEPKTDTKPEVKVAKTKVTKKRKVRSKVVRGPGGTTYIKEDFINF